MASQIKKTSVKGHPKNPNYFGKNYKSPVKKPNIDEILKEPLRSIKEEDKKIKTMIKLESQLIKLKTPIKVESTKFNKFIKVISSPQNRKLAFILPIILYRLSSLLLANKNVYINFMDVFEKNSDRTEWGSMSLMSKMYVIISDYMKLIYKKSNVLGIAETIILLNIILDEIPRIILATKYDNIDELPVLKLAKHLAQNVKKIDDVMVNKEKQDEQDKKIQETIILQRQQIETHHEVMTEYKQLLEEIKREKNRAPEKSELFDKRDAAKFAVNSARKNELKALNKGEYISKHHLKSRKGIGSKRGIGYEDSSSSEEEEDYIKPISFDNKGSKMYFKMTGNGTQKTKSI